MSKTNFTPEEAAQIAVEYTRKRVNELAKSLAELRDRELQKAIVKPHQFEGQGKHATTQTAGPAVSNVASGNMNPVGRNDALKAEDSPHGKEETSGEQSPDDMAKEELCKKCGKAEGCGCTPDMSKAEEKEKHVFQARTRSPVANCKICGKFGDNPAHIKEDAEEAWETRARRDWGGEKEWKKSMLKDSKGKEKDNGIHPDSTLPEDKKSEEVSADGSGGDIKKGKKLGKSEDLSKAAVVKPPMAKPPAGGGGLTPKAPPTSGTVKSGKDMEKAHPIGRSGITVAHQKRGGAGAGAHSDKRPAGGPSAADWEDEKPVAGAFGKKPKVEESPKELDKAGLNPQAKQHMLADASRQAMPAPAAPVRPSPTPAQHAERAGQFARFMPSPETTGHQMSNRPKPGIFGRLGKSEELVKMSDTKTSPARPRSLSEIRTRAGVNPAQLVGGEGPSLADVKLEGAKTIADVKSRTMMPSDSLAQKTKTAAAQTVAQNRSSLISQGAKPSPVLTAPPKLKTMPAGEALAPTDHLSTRVKSDTPTGETTTAGVKPKI